MTPRIELSKEKTLVGKSLKMTFANNKTAELWRSFMPRRKEIANNLTNDLISMSIFPNSFDFGFSNLNAEFDKWALVEVLDFSQVPEEMETYILKSGLYAVFEYTGLSTDTKVFEYIFGNWLPNSNFILDNRPHFEVLGDKYKNNDPFSEEEIWIPIKPKE